MKSDFLEAQMERRRVGKGAVLAISAATLLLLMLLAFCGAQFLVRRQVQAELDKIRAADEPVTTAELEVYYALPAEVGDATTLWMAAAEVLATPASEADARDLPWLDAWPHPPTPVGAPWPQQEIAEGFLEKYAEPLKKTRDAAAMGGLARYPTRFSDGLSMALNSQRDLRYVSSLLNLEYEVAIRRGNTVTACDSVHTMFALGRSLEKEPLMVSQLMRLAKDNMALGRLEQLLMTADVPADCLLQIDKDLAAIDYFEAFRRAMVGERVVGIETFANPKVLGSEAPTAVAWAVFGQADFAVYLQLMDELVAASAARNRSALIGAAQHAHQRVTEASGNWRYRVTKTLLPSLQAFIDAIGRGTARKDVGRMAIAAELYRRKHGRWPGSLDDLVPDFAPQVPTDPFSGLPIRLTISDDGCRIYSVGSDGIDHGGRVEEPGSPGDILCRLLNREPHASADD